MGIDEGFSVSAPAPVDPLANAVVHSGMVPPEVLDAYLAAPDEVRRRGFDAGQAGTAGERREGAGRPGRGLGVPRQRRR